MPRQSDLRYTVEPLRGERLITQRTFIAGSRSAM